MYLLSLKKVPSGIRMSLLSIGGGIAVSLGQCDLAIKNATELLSLNPPNPWIANQFRAVAYGAKGQYDLAIADWDAALRQNSNRELYIWDPDKNRAEMIRLKKEKTK
jgi:tetratricopeptide (TPR) repeat protein